jgi:peptide/nickel transport system ATP-binding protein
MSGQAAPAADSEPVQPLVELGSGQDIYERAAHPYTAGLIATIPVPQSAVERAKTGAAIAESYPAR